MSNQNNSLVARKRKERKEIRKKIKKLLEKWNWELSDFQ
jgi:hypothetical protein